MFKVHISVNAYSANERERWTGSIKEIVISAENVTRLSINWSRDTVRSVARILINNFALRAINQSHVCKTLCIQSFGFPIEFQASHVHYARPYNL